MLPDGQVLVTGGVSGGGFNDLSSAQHAAEIWDPATNGWTALASNSVDRGYHSVSILLPDATVLHGGSGNANIPGTTTAYPDQESHEIFQPPYFFKGARPVISSIAPSTFTYGASVQINTPNVGQVAKVRLIRLGSVTHAFDQNGRTICSHAASRAPAIAMRRRSCGACSARSADAGAGSLRPQRQPAPARRMGACRRTTALHD